MDVIDKKQQVPVQELAVATPRDEDFERDSNYQEMETLMLD